MASAVANLANWDSNNSRFNAEAAAWDSRPFVHQASQEAAKAILTRLDAFGINKAELSVLEIGCGTGILSFLLAPHVQSICAVDAAEGMIDVLNQKLLKPQAPKNILSLALLLQNPEHPALPPNDPGNSDGLRQKFDLITSHLVAHHIADLEFVMRTMLGCLVSGGCIMLTDFEDFGPEAKRFHPASKMDGVARHGINAQKMAELMKRVGFIEVDVRPHWSMKKTVEKYEGEFGSGYGGNSKEFQKQMGEEMDFPFLICFGKKQ